VRVLVNGEAREVPAGTTVAGLLRVLALESERVAVERNGRLVPRAQHAATELAEGDRLEVVTLVGGG
jgi:sulfur carrier protein